jgi:hypothetical protein
MGDPAVAVTQMESELPVVSPRIATVNFLPHSDVVGGFLYPARMNAGLFSIVALTGLDPSAAGVFGITSLAASWIQKEIGIRLAIGDGRQRITRFMISRVSKSVELGLAAGIGLALVGSGWWRISSGASRC